MEAESPAVLSDSEDSVSASQLGLLWARVHTLDIQLWSQSRAVETSRASQASESARYQVLASLVQELRIEIDSIKRLLQNLQSKVQRCESALNLHSLD